MASLPEAAAGSCDYTDYTVNNGSSAVMTPGVYCKKTLINSGGTATMQPGVYIFKEGEFEINSLSSVTGNGVMLYFADKDARLNVNSDSEFKVSAPTDGTCAGMLMFQSRDASTKGAPPFIVNSASGVKLEGVLYLPNGRLELNSNGVSNNAAAYTVFVVNQMVLNSASTLRVNANYSGATPLPQLLEGRMTAGSQSARLVK